MVESWFDGKTLPLRDGLMVESWFDGMTLPLRNGFRDGLVDVVLRE